LHTSVSDDVMKLQRLQESIVQAKFLTFWPLSNYKRCGTKHNANHWRSRRML